MTDNSDALFNLAPQLVNRVLNVGQLFNDSNKSVGEIAPALRDSIFDNLIWLLEQAESFESVSGNPKRLMQVRFAKMLVSMRNMDLITTGLNMFAQD